MSSGSSGRLLVFAFALPILIFLPGAALAQNANRRTRQLYHRRRPARRHHRGGESGAYREGAVGHHRHSRALHHRRSKTGDLKVATG